MKTITKLDKEDRILEYIKNCDAFKELVKSIPENEEGIISVAYKFTPIKEYHWYKDKSVNGSTREFDSGFFDELCREKVQKCLEKKGIIKELDAKGDTVIYAE